MNFIKRLNFILLMLVFIVSSCHDDDIIISENISCTENTGELVQNYDSTIVITCPIMFDYIHLNQFDYTQPVFNPTNPDEIIYIRVDNVGGNKEVWKYNFCTDETKFITDKASYGIDWSSKDWVIFSGFDKQLYKVKSNGDSLIQLTNNNNLFHNDAKWNEEGDFYLFEVFLTSDPIRLLISDENGNITDTLPPCVGTVSWNWDNEKIFFSNTAEDASNTYYGEYNQNTREIQQLGSLPINGNSFNAITNVKYSSSSNSLYWNNSYHIAKHSLNNSDVEYLTTGFDNRLYINIDVSPTENVIITSRSNLRQIDECTIEGETALYLIDVTGEKERRISIPE